LRNDKTRLVLLSSILAGVCLLSGCARNSTPVVTPFQAVILAGQTLQFTASLNGSPTTQVVWKVNGVLGGSGATGTISSTGLYTAPTDPAVETVTVTAEVSADDVSSTPGFIQVFDPSKFAPGTVAPTNNPLVALYSLNVPEGANVQIQFGQSTNYGLTTWAQPAPNFGGTVSIFVAGMRASTTYHMQALVSLPTGTQVADSDHTFTTGPLPAPVSNITIQQTGGMTPAPGVELLCLDPTDGKGELTAVVTDLSGNVIWYYNIGSNTWPFPMKLLPNGHMLMVAAPVTNSAGQLPPGSPENEVREIDLAGNVINQITLSQIDSGLASLGASFDVAGLHHDILQLPNGHRILLMNYEQTFNNQPGLPPGTVVLGDVLLDWDPQAGAVWYWSTFDHFDVSRIPYGISNGLSDWTHANAVIYSPDDGDLILSMRDQNWIIKINYENGMGDGSVLWRFGYQGDFTLAPGEAPIQWNYGQHYPSIVSPNSAGVFSLMFFDNGNNRLVDANNDVCGTSGNINCYSDVPVFQLDESTKTAQLQTEMNLSPAYSVCCGDAQFLSNGDLEYDVAADVSPPVGSYVQEVTQGQSPQLVWQMNIPGPLAYRAFRIPSLYPGVAWSEAAIATSEASAAKRKNISDK
jgi:arylsulfate sulfotransferase